jgi:hypothetical protein
VGHQISIPPETPEEAAEDAAFEAAWAARPKAETTRRVVSGSPERHAGLAMIALAVHEDATSLHFHFVGEPAPGDHSLRAFEDALDALDPPALRDNHGIAYEPVQPRPVSASSHSREPDSDPRRVIIGAWLYTPAVPDEATTFLSGRRRGSERDAIVRRHTRPNSVSIGTPGAQPSASSPA